MKAFVYEYGQFKIKHMNKPIAGNGEVVIAMHMAGLNRRDLYIPNRLGLKESALILGSDGAGVVEEIGENVSHVSIGDEVIINPSLRWYKNTGAPPNDFDILRSEEHTS